MADHSVGGSSAKTTPARAAQPGALVDAFAHYLERTLGEARAGRVAVLADNEAPPRGTAVVVATGHASRRWLWYLRARHHLRVAFRATAGSGGVEVPLTVLDRWDPTRLAPTPEGFDVLAVMTTFNEADIVEGIVAGLRRDGVRVHVVDNWSTDGTDEIVGRLSHRDRGVTVERFPSDGPSAHFELERLLTRVEEVAHASGAHWVVNHDADEIRQSPWPGVSLRRGLYAVDRFGFNCVDHTVLNFRPTSEAEWDGTAPLDGALRWFEFGTAPAHFIQRKAWKPQAEPARFAWSGGHDTLFEGRRVFPYKFVTRHYPIRSSAHGRRKVLNERQARWSPEERARGWHTHYDGYSASSSFVWDAATLHAAGDLDGHLLVQRLSGAGLAGNPFEGEGPGVP
jgi:hypothetical protein